MTGAEQVVHREFNALFRREEILDEFLIATDRLRALVVDSRDVVDPKLDTGNCGPAFDDLNEAAQRVCCRASVHDGCACSDVVPALPHCGAPGSRHMANASGRPATPAAPTAQSS